MRNFDQGWQRPVKEKRQSIYSKGSRVPFYKLTPQTPPTLSRPRIDSNYNQGMHARCVDDVNGLMVVPVCYGSSDSIYVYDKTGKVICSPGWNYSAYGVINAIAIVGDYMFVFSANLTNIYNWRTGAYVNGSQSVYYLVAQNDRNTFIQKGNIVTFINGTNKQLMTVDLSGGALNIVSVVSLTGLVYSPMYMDVDPSGIIYCTDNTYLYKYNSAGTQLFRNSLQASGAFGYCKQRSSLLFMYNYQRLYEVNSTDGSLLGYKDFTDQNFYTTSGTSAIVCGNTHIVGRTGPYLIFFNPVTLAVLGFIMDVYPNENSVGLSENYACYYSDYASLSTNANWYALHTFFQELL